MRGQLRRRAFIVGAATGAVLTACRAADAPATSTSSTSSATSTAASTAPDWTHLAEALDGAVALPSDAGYADAKTVFNSRFSDATPAAVVMPASVDDVRRAMEFAADNDVLVAPRSGGHSYVGASARTGAMVIDLRALAGPPHYDESSTLATVQAATSLDDVQSTLAGFGRLIPSGSCPSVGVAGLTLGGGLGTDTRTAGLTCDALTSATVVLPGGDVVTASPDDRPDLFWALRGGGGGNFGVVTSLSFRTQPAVDRDVVTMRFPAAAVADVVQRVEEWIAAADRSTWGMVNVPTDGSGCSVVLATPAGTGPDRAAGVAAAIGTAALSTTTRTLGRLDFVRYFEGGDGARRPRAFVAGSDVIGTMTAEAAAAVADAAGAWPSGAPGGASVIVESLSGAVQDVAPDESAFPWRRQASSIQWYAEPSTPEGTATALSWLGLAHQAVRAHSVGAYVNYVESDVPPARYAGANLARLAAVRQRYDPDRTMGSGLDY